MTRRSLRRDLDEFANVYNAAWSRNWGFVPLSKEDLDEMALNYQLVFDGDWFMIAENETETVAAAITIPDINQVLKKMNGRLLPLGWWYYLNKYKIIDRLRVGFLGVLPEYQHTGVAAELYMEHFDGGREDAPQVRRGGLDPREQPGHEPRASRRWAARSSSATASTSACSAPAPLDLLARVVEQLARAARTAPRPRRRRSSRSCRRS